jgi:hypothetical protein
MIRALADERDRALSIAAKLKLENAELRRQVKAGLDTEKASNATARKLLNEARNEIARLNGQTITITHIRAPQTLEELINLLEWVLDEAPTRWLPKPTRIEFDATRQTSIAWFGGRGSHLGTATRDGELDPGIHRRNGINDLLEG